MQRPEVDWFSSERTGRGRKLVTKSQAPTTLGKMEFKADIQGDRRGSLSARLTNANITRTLAHLLADHGEAERFLDVVRPLDPFEFFRMTSRAIPYCFGGGGGNWIADVDLAHRHLGADPFGRFLPVYVEQLQRLIATVLAPPAADRFATDGTEVVAGDDDVTCRWSWADAQVPQIEAYFERHHVRAVGAVRAAAAVALSSFDHCGVQCYPNHSSDFVEREGDCLTISGPLTKISRFKVYAKARNRIRFEVVRLGKGDYRHVARGSHPQDRLVGIINLQRANLLTAARWEVVGALFDEQPSPQTNDLARLCGIVAEACATHGGSVETVLMQLLDDGGTCTNTDTAFPDAVVVHLERKGVLDRHIVRKQDHRDPQKRFALTPAYRHLAQVLRGYLSGQ